MAGKLPFIKLFPNDWLSDDVAGCSLAAQMLWMRMMFIMHASTRYGYLEEHGTAMQPERIARKCGIPLAEYVTLLFELDNVGVPSRQPLTDIIYSRRMVRDSKQRRAARRNGKLGGNPKLKPPDLPVVKGEVNPRLNLPLTSDLCTLISEGKGSGENREPWAVLLDVTGLGINCNPKHRELANRLTKKFPIEDVQRGIDLAFAKGIGGAGALSFAATVLAGEAAKSHLRNGERATSGSGATNREDN